MIIQVYYNEESPQKVTFWCPPPSQTMNSDSGKMPPLNTTSSAADVAASMNVSHSCSELSTSKALHISLDDNPNQMVYLKMESIVERMQRDEGRGVPVRTVKSFMTKIPSVFTGQDLIQWMLTHLDLNEVSEALILANRMAACGYFFPIDDHVLAVKNDNTYYRFQVRK